MSLKSKKTQEDAALYISFFLSLRSCYNIPLPSPRDPAAPAGRSYSKQAAVESAMCHRAG